MLGVQLLQNVLIMLHKVDILSQFFLYLQSWYLQGKCQRKLHSFLERKNYIEQSFNFVTETESWWSKKIET